MSKQVKSCITFKNLKEVDLSVLNKLIKAGIKDLKKSHYSDEIIKDLRHSRRSFMFRSFTLHLHLLFLLWFLLLFFPVVTFCHIFCT
jgi:hypothetical protein